MTVELFSTVRDALAKTEPADHKAFVQGGFDPACPWCAARAALQGIEEQFEAVREGWIAFYCRRFYDDRSEAEEEWEHFLQNVPILESADDCPDIRKHTKHPEGYVAWHEWAEKKGKTHRQERCPTCGFFSIWKKR